MNQPFSCNNWPQLRRRRVWSFLCSCLTYGQRQLSLLQLWQFTTPAIAVMTWMTHISALISLMAGLEVSFPLMSTETVWGLVYLAFKWGLVVWWPGNQSLILLSSLRNPLPPAISQSGSSAACLWEKGGSYSPAGWPGMGLPRCGSASHLWASAGEQKWPPRQPAEGGHP